MLRPQGSRGCKATRGAPECSRWLRRLLATASPTI
jgi:hypothetical protein